MRTLAVFAGSFSSGIFLAQYLLPQHWLLPTACVCLLLGCGALLLPGIWRRRGVLIGTALALALGYNWLYCRQVARPMAALAGTEQAVTMTLCDYAAATDYGAKATVKIDGLPAKAVYYGDEALLELRPGQTVSDLVYVQDAGRIRDDDITTFTSKGVFLLAYQRGEPEYGAGSAASPRWWPVRLGRAMGRNIQEIASGDAAGFLAAILTGDKSGLSVQAATDLSEAGLYHILAVSGMHCGFLLTLVTLLAGRHRRRLVATVTIPLLVFYALLTGGSPSIVRACVMLSFLLAAPLFHRDSDGPTALTAALFLILLKNPFAAASISLQLSFGAMAGLLWLTPKLYALLIAGKKRGRAARFVLASFSATMGALVFTVPISAVYFGFLVLVSPLSNLLSLWAAGIAFMLGLLAVLAGFAFTPLALALAAIPRVLTGFILFAAHLLAKLPYHAVYFVNPTLKYWLLFAYALFALAWLLRPKSGRRYAVAGLCAAVTLAVTVCLGTARYDARLDALVLDVGQGQSILLSSGNACALVDCGSGNSWYDAGGIAADHLLTMGHDTLDYLILTHYDTDHVNGFESLLARLKVETLFVPAATGGNELEPIIRALAERYGTVVQTIHTKETIPLNGAELTVFPPVGESEEDNESGLTVLASAGERKLLITGDMDAARERSLLEAYPLPQVEYLVAGHHGSKTSTSEDLLDALTPEAVLISVGSNSYGHPTEETLRRVAERGCGIYRTDLQGTLHLPIN